MIQLNAVSCPLKCALALYSQPNRESNTIKQKTACDIQSEKKNYQRRKQQRQLQQQQHVCIKWYTFTYASDMIWTNFNFVIVVFFNVCLALHVQQKFLDKLWLCKVVNCIQLGNLTWNKCSCTRNESLLWPSEKKMKRKRAREREREKKLAINMNNIC